MTFGVLDFDFLIDGARLSKDKRRVVKSLNVKFAAVIIVRWRKYACPDFWQRAHLSAVVVSHESRHANSQLSEIARFIETRIGGSIVGYQTELI